MIGRVGSGGSSRRYYLKDHLGSIRAVLDGGGGVRETRDYYPFGLPMPGRHEKGSPPTQEDYTGHVKDGETGLHYAGARYYSAALGRWNAVDPLADKNFADSPYAYAVNNPLRYVDPTGRDTTVETESGDQLTIEGEGGACPRCRKGWSLWQKHRAILSQAVPPEVARPQKRERVLRRERPILGLWVGHLHLARSRD